MCRNLKCADSCVLIMIPGDEDRVEGRRQRAEKARQRKMEEDQLRDLEMRYVYRHFIR